MSAVLQGIRVLEVGHYIAAPHCCQILADYGADVIKLEPPEGEPGRRALPRLGDESLYFTAQNRNKRSVAMDIKRQEARPVIDALLRASDVVVMNLAPRVPNQYGLDYDSVQKVRSDTIVVQISGFGASGERRDWGAYDGIAQAMGGLVDITGFPDGPPTVVGLFVADHLAGIQAAFSVLLALRERDKTGKGQVVDVSMVDCLVPMAAYNISQAAVGGAVETRTGNASRHNVCNVFACQDGYVYIGLISDAIWDRFARALGRLDWLADERYATRNLRLANRAPLEAEIAAWTASRRKADLATFLQGCRVPCAPVNSIADVSRDEVLRQRQTIVDIDVTGIGPITVPGLPIKFSDCGGDVKRLPPPRLGEHSIEVLNEIELSRAEIDLLLRAGVVAAM